MIRDVIGCTEIAVNGNRAMKQQLMKTEMGNRYKKQQLMETEIRNRYKKQQLMQAAI